MDALIKLLIYLLGFYMFCLMIYSTSPGLFWIMLLSLVGFTSWLFCCSGNDSANNNINKDNNNASSDDFQQRLDNGEIRTYDDVVYHNGRYYENENSEEWEDFEYQYEEDHRR